MWLTQLTSFKLMRLGQKSAGNNSIRQSWHTFASVHQEAEDLVRFLNPKGLRNTQAGPRRPLLILAFDDADVLAGIRVKEGSFLSELIRALGTVSDLPIFSLFLSTSANLLPPVKSTPFGALNSDVDLPLYPPITEISFDDLAFPAVEDTLTLNQVTEDKWIMHLGRPLFGSRYDAIVRNKLCHSNPYHTPLRLAKKKLLDGPTKLNDEKGLGSLACLSVRFALDFDLADKSGRDVSLTLIERHMRLCVAATTGFEKLVTTAASEPFLAEAARELMLSFAPFGAVRLLAENPSLSNIIRVGGQHGELIAALIIMRARDAAAVVTEYKSSRAISVNDFMRALLPIPAYETFVSAKPQYWRTGEDMPFSKAFEGYSTWFNHVIKVHQSDMINTKHLWKFITRGAMVMCVDNQLGIDIVLPICARDNKLSRSTVSAILIQVKNDKNFKYQVDKTLFECMDPFRVGLFSEGDRPLPVIRMVFALGSDKRGVVFPAVEDEIDTFTAYDIWCAGLSPHTFRDTAIDLEWYRSLFLRSLRPHDEFDFKDDKDNLG
ncbi:hypothetical protein EI94DRAFT_409046 [Lactarius quietus]|nr:hypothetical protein EI94DRAFT_409046 [Lactarius quietus]